MLFRELNENYKQFTWNWQSEWMCTIYVGMRIIQQHAHFIFVYFESGVSDNNLEHTSSAIAYYFLDYF